MIGKYTPLFEVEEEVEFEKSIEVEDDGTEAAPAEPTEEKTASKSPRSKKKAPQLPEASEEDGELELTFEKVFPFIAFDCSNSLLP